VERGEIVAASTISTTTTTLNCSAYEINEGKSTYQKQPNFKKKSNPFPWIITKDA
jgi:hypothetical protein